MSPLQTEPPSPQSSSSLSSPLSRSTTEELLNVPLKPDKNVKISETALLDHEVFCRLSISSISTCGPSRVYSSLQYTEPSRPQRLKTSGRHFWHRNYGLFLVIVSQLFGALMNAATALCCLWMWWTEIPDFPLGAKGVRWLLFGRGIAGFVGIYAIYYSILYLPVAEAIVITFLGPTVAAYGCYLFLKEPFPRSAQYASLISLLGVVMIARPTSFFSSDSSSTSLPSPNNTTTNATITSTPPPESDFPIPTSAQRLSAVTIALIGVLGGAGAITTVRLIGQRAHALLSINYLAVSCILISSISLLAPIEGTPSFQLPATFRQWYLLIFVGFCGFIMQLFLATGLAMGGRGEGGRATNMLYTNMLFALALDRVVFGLTPEWWSVGGSGMILGSAIYVATQKGEEVDESEMSEVGRGLDEEMAGIQLERGSGTEEEAMAFLSEAGCEGEVRGFAV
ncbi:hypothetical protein HYALB_00001119 [Hymenoscyphus albidus]|uniref:EamA domain-containing protein n=1 Tax=Hymenoscyphus albidus TaxID=595503 RepID=A0A9N9LFX2_9HELO|nr:hypothetical protein HYALB_00001119 [Hymenoscyphus albidus]